MSRRWHCSRTYMTNASVNWLGSRGRAVALASLSVKLDAEDLQQSQPSTSEWLQCVCGKKLKPAVKAGVKAAVWGSSESWKSVWPLRTPQIKPIILNMNLDSALVLTLNFRRKDFSILIRPHISLHHATDVHTCPKNVYYASWVAAGKE